MATKTTINRNFDGDFSLLIKHKISGGYEIIEPIVENGVKWETDRQGSPGKLTFKVYYDKSGNLNFQEGDAVVLRYRESGGEWQAVFAGYIFTKKRTKDNWIDVTAYDQLRYLKNKDTLVYTKWKASDVVRKIVKDYKLIESNIEDTTFVISERVEDNQSLLDIVQNAIDLTLVGSGELYVLYADSVGICLRNTKNMMLDVVINESVAEDFDYDSTIDNDVYNEIELYYDNDETNKREYFHAVDATNISNWGILRYTESLQDSTNAKDRAEKLLKVYNRKKRTLKVSKAFGDCRCRAGASVIVDLNLGDIKVRNYMLIEKATHTFTKNEYRMDLTLGGTTEFE